VYRCTKSIAHFDMDCRKDSTSGGVTGVDSSRCPDGPVAEGERQREDARDDEDDDDSVACPSYAAPFLGSRRMTHEHVPLDS